MVALKIAFDPPDRTVGGCAARSRPIDFAHLAKQTMGDKELESEVLNLFSRLARGCMDRLAREPEADRPDIAHQLKGAARGIGAFAIASAAEELEGNPGDAAIMAKLAHAVTETENLICGLSR